MKKSLNITVMVLCLIVSFALGAYVHYKATSKIYLAGVNYLKENELKYYYTKSKLTDCVQEYIKSVAPSSDLSASLLIDMCEEYNVDILFVLAQGEQESKFGTKGMASKTNSVWNVGAYDGLTYDKINRDFKYDSPNESIKPYLKLLTSQYLTINAEEGLLKNFVDYTGKRYATDTHYEERLQFRYTNIAKTTQIDSLQKMLKYWAIKSNRYDCY